MQPIYAMRAAHLVKVIRFFENIGTPVERELARVQLPTRIEEVPNANISSKLGYEFRQRCLKIEKIGNIGWRIHGSCHIKELSPQALYRVNDALTVHDRLWRFTKSVQFESNYVQCGMIPTAEGADIVFNPTPTVKYVTADSFGEWHRVMGSIAVIQTGAGPGWRPAKVGFTGRFRPCNDVLEYFRNTRIRFGQPQTSISVPSDILALRVSPLFGPVRSTTGYVSLNPLPYALDDKPTSRIRSLRSVLQPYFREARPSVALAAEIASVSIRSLQRGLRRAGLSFSELLDQCCFDSATRLLADPGIKIIDVALSLGYDDPSHFSRAFRRISSLSPRDYRAAIIEGRIRAPRASEPSKSLGRSGAGVGHQVAPHRCAAPHGNFMIENAASGEKRLETVISA